MENSATLFFHSAIMIVIMTLCELASMGIFSKFSYHFYSKMNDTVLLYSVSFLYSKTLDEYCNSINASAKYTKK